MPCKTSPNCEICPQEKTCAKLLTWTVIVKAQDAAKKAVAQAIGPKSSKVRKKRFNPLAFLAALGLAAAFDSVGDPSFGDSTIGDAPDDIITAQVFECVSESGHLSYVLQATDRPGELCFPADLNRPPLP